MCGTDSAMVQAFGKVLAIRMALLVAIALCIAVAITSNDMLVRALAAVVAITVEIVRDALLGIEMSALMAASRKRNGGRKAEP
jgi:molybdenum cofactor biosynthesis enzyme